MWLGRATRHLDMTAGIILRSTLVVAFFGAGLDQLLGQEHLVARTVMTTPVQSVIALPKHEIRNKSKT